MARDCRGSFLCGKRCTSAFDDAAGDDYELLLYRAGCDWSSLRGENALWFTSHIGNFDVSDCCWKLVGRAAGRRVEDPQARSLNAFGGSGIGPLPGRSEEH